MKTKNRKTTKTASVFSIVLAAILALSIGPDASAQGNGNGNGGGGGGGAAPGGGGVQNQLVILGAEASADLTQLLISGANLGAAPFHGHRHALRSLPGSGGPQRHGV